MPTAVARQASLPIVRVLMTAEVAPDQPPRKPVFKQRETAKAAAMAPRTGDAKHSIRERLSSTGEEKGSENSKVAGLIRQSLQADQNEPTRQAITWNSGKMFADGL